MLFCLQLKLEMGIIYGSTQILVDLNCQNAIRTNGILVTLLQRIKALRIIFQLINLNKQILVSQSLVNQLCLIVQLTKKKISLIFIHLAVILKLKINKIDIFIGRELTFKR